MSMRRPMVSRPTRPSPPPSWPHSPLFARNQDVPVMRTTGKGDPDQVLLALAGVEEGDVRGQAVVLLIFRMCKAGVVPQRRRRGTGEHVLLRRPRTPWRWRGAIDGLAGDAVHVNVEVRVHPRIPRDAAACGTLLHHPDGVAVIDTPLWIAIRVIAGVVAPQAAVHDIRERDPADRADRVLAVAVTVEEAVHNDGRPAAKRLRRREKQC